jgi:pimeloyl-ACP methyl ester carboxylesterase
MLEKIKKYSFEKLGNDVVDVLRHLKIESTHFVGISLGTIIIRDIVERFPDMSKSMILAGAVMKINFRGQILMRLGASLKSILPYLLLYKLFAFVIMPKKKHKESRSLFINEATKLYQKEFIRWFTLVSQINPLLSLFRFKESTVPTLYVMGSEDYMFLPSISKLVQNHKSASLVIVANCGHVVNVEKPDEFNSFVIRFICALNSNR